MIPTSPYPLVWPDAVPRTPNRMDDKFRTTLAKALNNVEKSVQAFGRDSGKLIRQMEITSNVAGIRAPKIVDPGVAVWFMWDDAPRCFAIDRYHTVAANLQAIHLVLEARRTELRHAGLHTVRAAFRGFVAALPAPGATHWTTVLGVGPDATPDQITAAYRTKARELGATGNDAARAELNVARDKALEERGSK